MEIKIIKDLMDKYKRPFYIYDEKIIANQIQKLRTNFPEFEFLYSIKTNPNKDVIKFISKNNIGSDAASKNEVFKSIDAGIPKEKIIYSAAGKTKQDIEETYDKCIITADSYHELEMINEVAKEHNIVLRVGVRINSNYAIEGGDILPSKFGIDEESLLSHKEFIDSLENIKICGIHVHLKSQILNYETLYNYYKDVLKLAVFCVEEMGFDMDYVNFGGGLGIAYSQRENELEIDSLGQKCKELINGFKEKLNCRLIIESGRFIVCQSGTYVTYVIDKKVSRGANYVIVANGYNGFHKPALAEMVMSYADGPLEKIHSVEPMFTSYDAYEVKVLNESQEKEKVTVCGNLCTAADLIGKNLVLPKVEIGDIIAITNAGSYGFTLSPVLFSSHDIPYEIYLNSNNEVFISKY
ncbi:diaminopimelate decarboxylase family protein [Intestinibacter bartlettii]|uniref:Diaminopimelate decarboxylase n=1 Tax=Intestinibacter bartlettii TaxID=261299 RepID=A0ABS6DX08_9FIRM|nr:hypothetical protein [Intestinibacter bartlettii]MBU5336388.1 hypothetical protein [Intestinibacter bartlettii]